MKVMRSYRVVSFVVFFLCLIGCAFNSEKADTAFAERTESLAVVRKSVGDDFSINEIFTGMDLDRKKSRIEFSWKPIYNKIVKSGLEDEVDCFVFKYIVVKDGHSVPWRTEVAPSAKKFMTDYKLSSGQNTSFFVFLRFRDKIGPDEDVPSQRSFCFASAKKTLQSEGISVPSGIFDSDDSYDRQLWYLGMKNATTIVIPGSGIIGTHGYDMRKGGSEINPGGLVPGGVFLNTIALAIDDSGAILVSDLSGTETKHHEVTTENLTSYAKAHSEESGWGLSWITGDDKGKESFASYIGDAVSHIGATKGPDGKVKLNSTAEGTAAAIVGLLNSGATSVLSNLCEKSAKSNSSSVNSMSRRVAGDVKTYVYKRRERLDPKYYDVKTLKKSKYMNEYFLKDVNDASISPEELFDKYGTHLPFEIILGGKLFVNYWTESGNYNSIEEIGGVTEKIFDKGDTSSVKPDIANFLDSSSSLEVHAWGGSGANSMLNKLSDYYNVMSSWQSSVNSSNSVVIDMPGLVRCNSAAGQMAPIWLYADTEERKNEIMLAFSRYVLESSYDVNSLLYQQPRYIQDIVFYKLNTNSNSLAGATNKFNEMLYQGSLTLDDFSKSIYKSNTKELSDYFAFCKTFSNSGKPISFGGGVYGTAIYTFNKDLALRGIAITEIDASERNSSTVSAEEDFRLHAQKLIGSYCFSGNADIDAGQKRVGDWYMCDCVGYNSNVRFWRSKKECGKRSQAFPISSISLCFEKGSAEEGWEDVTTLSGHIADVYGVAVSVKRERTV